MNFEFQFCRTDVKLYAHYSLERETVKELKA